MFHLYIICRHNITTTEPPKGHDDDGKKVDGRENLTMLYIHPRMFCVPPRKFAFVRKPFEFFLSERKVSKHLINIFSSNLTFFPAPCLFRGSIPFELFASERSFSEERKGFPSGKTENVYERTQKHAFPSHLIFFPSPFPSLDRKHHLKHFILGEFPPRNCF